ncbi:DUF2523 family protein [Acinetobacter puyangensis]|uniref:DUF2523 family protein n=1 Tax=Acinetobacter puyangensis TaxID=1096779 RepID=UPI003A4D8B8F
MPLLATVLVPVLTLFLRFFIARILIGAGLTIVTYSFVTYEITRLRNLLDQYLHTLPSNILGYVQTMRFDFYISAVFSAYLIVAAVKGAKVFLGKA